MADPKQDKDTPPDLIDTITPAEVPEDAAKAIEENGEPFEGNNA